MYGPRRLNRFSHPEWQIIACCSIGRGLVSLKDHPPPATVRNSRDTDLCFPFLWSPCAETMKEKAAITKHQTGECGPTGGLLYSQANTVLAWAKTSF